MQRIKGVLREHVLGSEGGRCWQEPYIVDIRYHSTTDEVHVVWVPSKGVAVPSPVECCSPLFHKS